MSVVQPRMIPDDCPFCGLTGYCTARYEPTQTIVKYICGHNIIMKKTNGKDDSHERAVEAMRTALEE